jgi:hypothetical protein
MERCTTLAINDGSVDTQDPVEVWPGVVKLYGDLTPAEIEAATALDDLVVLMIMEMHRLAEAALAADRERATALLPNPIVDYVAGKGMKTLSYLPTQQMLADTQTGARAMGVS